MESNVVIFRRSVNKTGDSLSVTIPRPLAEYLDLKPKDKLMLIPDTGKHGNFVAFFKESEPSEEN